MTHPVALSPVDRLWTERFTDLSGHGLFVGPWMASASDTLADLEDMAGALFHAADTPGALPAILGHLVSIRRHCLWATRASDPAIARTRYQLALTECQAALHLVHDATDGVRGSLASWALGVHTLVQAQIAMPDGQASKKLAGQALEHLLRASDPLCGGAQSDRLAAEALMEEPDRLANRMQELPFRILRNLEQAKAEVDLHENLMNLRLTDVHEQYNRVFQSVLWWIVANLALMASVPLNAVYGTRVPWSLPFLAALVGLWWWTWGRPYRDGLYLFSWLASRKTEALQRFRQAADQLPDPGHIFTQEAMFMLAEGRGECERLKQFCLFTMPDQLNTVDEAEKITRDGRSLLTGTWMGELDDRHPWPLTDLVPVAPYMLSHTLRIWYGTSEH